VGYKIYEKLNNQRREGDRLKTILAQDYCLEDCPVIEKRLVAPGFCRLVFYAPEIARQAIPGQFVMVHMPPSTRHMLPRPYSICSVNIDRGELVVFFEIGGRGAEMLAEVMPGTSLRVLGPLGRGFPEVLPGSLLIAGGMGVAPLIFLAASTDVPRTLVYGSRSSSRLACPPEDLNIPGLKVIVTTEDGSRGIKGTACDVAEKVMPESSAVFACGPRYMLAAVAASAQQCGVKAWVSVEERMACGIGACLGCVVETDQGYLRVCKDGPVFPAGEVNLTDEHTECECQSGRH
jgi:dihydroorotate dehydrogenase electron transfer subunit